jgi:hypothetical protein
MSQVSKLVSSQKEWKAKAIERGASLRAAKQQLKQQKKIVQQQEKEIELLKEQLKKNLASTDVIEKFHPPVPVLNHRTSMPKIRGYCVNLFSETKTSFRSLAAILSVLSNLNLISIYIPHFTSIINWSLRFGLGKLKQVKPIHEPWLAIVDYSIGIGSKKILVVLRVPLNALSQQEQENGIQLKDCECIGLHIDESPNGETVAKALTETFTNSGYPKAIIKDNDSILNKGVRLLIERQGVDISAIDDISHVFSNALEKEFKSEEAYQEMLDLRLNFNNQVRQTEIACLTAPQLRGKGRFLSISRQTNWLKIMLELPIFSLQRETKISVEKVVHLKSELTKMADSLNKFQNLAETSTKMMKLLKTKGLDEDTIKESKQLLNPLPAESHFKQVALNWLDKTLAIKQKLIVDSSVTLLITSDIIESLFGSFKNIIGRNPLTDIGRSVLLIPVLCGASDKDTVTQVLSTTSQVELNNWEKEYTPCTVRKKRQYILGKQYLKSEMEII